MRSVRKNVESKTVKCGFLSPPRWACYAARHKTFITVKVGLPEEKICVLMRYSKFFRPDMKASLPSFTYTEASSKLLYTEYRSVRPWSEERFMSVLKEHLISTQCKGCFQYISCTHTHAHTYSVQLPALIPSTPVSVGRKERELSVYNLVLF